MKTVLAATITATTAAAFAITPAAATSLINKDSRGYDIAVSSSSGGGTNRTSINGGTTKSGICSSLAATCTIVVEGVGEIEVPGSSNVIIRNGELMED